MSHGFGRFGRFGVSLACTMAFTAAAHGVINFGQIDDFQSGTASWGEGFASPNGPTFVSTGGPNGAGDGFLQNVSTGGFGAGGKQVMFNTAQWAGDYNTAHVSRVELKLKNLGTTPMSIRLAFSGGAGSRFGTKVAVALPAGGGWVNAAFDLSPSKLQLLVGSDTATQALSSVAELRVLSADTQPSYNGDSVAATLGVDSIRATGLPGDANFDNAVGFSDLVVLAQHYNQAGGATWTSGDFNFDGKVAFDDLVILAQHYNTTASVLAAGDVGDAAFQSDWALARSIVPEPTLALLSSGGLAATARRRRRPARGV